MAPGRFFLETAVPLEYFGVSINSREPGAGADYWHAHTTLEELYLFLEGEGEMALDDDEYGDETESASDDNLDCAGEPNGAATLDECGTCDTDPRNNCVRDCEGVWGGEAYEDNCGVCDADPTNDCFDGTTGTLSIEESDTFNIGNGVLFWSRAGFADQQNF